MERSCTAMTIGRPAVARTGITRVEEPTMAHHHHQHVDDHARGERLIMWGYFYLGAGAILLLGFVLNATGSSSRLGLMPSQTEQLTSLLTAIIGLVSAVGGFIALLKGKQAAGR
jgi:hypothetical protein